MPFKNLHNQTMLSTSLTLIFKKLRLSNPWNYKAPFLIAVPYLIIAITKPPFDCAILSIMASLVTILGIAGFGYFINDLTDIEKDNLIGKENAVSKLPDTKRLMLLLILLIMAITPWFYLPLNWLNTSLLFFEFLLFVIYSFPPFRLKERGVAGVITDALYAHTNPAVLAAITFLMITNTDIFSISNLLITLASWQFVVGIRNIILHQLKDYENDQQSDTKTFVRNLGRNRSETWLKYLIIPLEVISFIFFAACINEYIPSFISAYLIFVPFTFFRVWVLWKRSMSKRVEENLNLFLDGFYTGRIPLLIAGHLFCLSPKFSVLFFLHLLLFKNGVSDFIRETKNIIFTR